MQVYASAEAWLEYRKIITEGRIGEPIPDFPANPAFVLPNVVATGIYQRLDKLVDHIKSSANYTAETGALLRILPKAKTDKPQEEVKPTANVFAAAMGHHFSVVVEGREKATTFDVFIRRDGQENWELVKTASGKSVDVTVALSNAGMPERIQVMIQLMKNNEPYGQPSDAVYVTLNP